MTPPVVARHDSAEAISGEGMRLHAPRHEEGPDSSGSAALMIHNSPDPSYLKRGNFKIPHASGKKEVLAMTKKRAGLVPALYKSM